MSDSEPKPHRPPRSGRSFILDKSNIDAQLKAGSRASSPMPEGGGTPMLGGQRIASSSDLLGAGSPGRAGRRPLPETNQGDGEAPPVASPPPVEIQRGRGRGRGRGMRRGGGEDGSGFSSAPRGRGGRGQRGRPLPNPKGPASPASRRPQSQRGASSRPLPIPAKPALPTKPRDAPPAPPKPKNTLSNSAGSPQSPGRPMVPPKPIPLPAGAIPPAQGSPPVAPAKPTLPPKPSARPAVPPKPQVPPKPPKPAPPPKPKTIQDFTEQDIKKLIASLKKLCGANKQLVSVSNVALRQSEALCVTKPNLSEFSKHLKAARESLESLNKKLTGDVRAAVGTSDQVLVRSLIADAIEVAHETAFLVAASKKVTLESDDDNLFKIMLTATTTAWTSLKAFHDILLSAKGELEDESLINQLDIHARTVHQSQGALVSSTAEGTMISEGKKLEIEAAANATLRALTKLAFSFSRPLSQQIVVEAKVCCCTISSLAALLSDTAQSQFFLAKPTLRQKIIELGEGIKEEFVTFMDTTKSLVTELSADAPQIMKDALSSLRDKLTEAVAMILAISSMDNSESDAPEPTDEHKEQADIVLTVALPIMKEKQTNAEHKDENAGEDNIWDTPPDSEENIMLVDGNVKAACLNKLIERLTHPQCSDTVFMKTFITTYRSFVTTSELLRKLKQRYEVPDAHLDHKLHIQLRICNVLKFWVLKQFREFTEKHVKLFEEFAVLLQQNKSYVKFATTITQTLSRIHEDQQLTKNEIVNISIEQKVPLRPANLLFVFDEEELARQLTLVDNAIYDAIHPSELLNQAWNKPKLKHRAPNVLALIKRSTEITKWVASFILWQPTVRERVRAFVKIINIAEHLKNLNNFTSLMAIISGINYSSVFRLKVTRAELPEATQQTFKDLEELMNCNGAYATYRAHLHSVNPPCVPFLGVYLTDLTFVEDGNPDQVNGLVNFKKRQMVYNIIDEISRYQQIGYTFNLVDNIAHFLTELPYNEDEQLYQLSLKREPRGAKREDIS